MSEPVDLDAIVRWFDDLERMGLPAKSVRALVTEVEALRGENQRLREELRKRDEAIYGPELP